MDTYEGIVHASAIFVADSMYFDAPYGNGLEIYWDTRNEPVVASSGMVRMHHSMLKLSSQPWQNSKKRPLDMLQCKQ